MRSIQHALPKSQEALVDAVAFELIGVLLLDAKYKRGTCDVCRWLSLLLPVSHMRSVIDITLTIRFRSTPTPSTEGSARRRVVCRRIAHNDWNGFQKAYPEELLASGEVQPSAQGFADTTPGERGDYWKLFKAQNFNEVNEYSKLLQDAKRVVATSIGGQP